MRCAKAHGVIVLHVSYYITLCSLVDRIYGYWVFVLLVLGFGNSAVQAAMPCVTVVGPHFVPACNTSLKRGQLP